MIRFFQPFPTSLRKCLALLCATALLLPLLAGAVYAEPAPDPGVSDGGTLPVWNGGSAESYAGSGTQSDPYRISTAEELSLLAQQVRAGNSFAGTHFLLTADLLLNDVGNYSDWDEKAPARRWIPIGGYAAAQVNSAEDFSALSAESGGLYVRTENSYQPAEQYNSGVIYYRLTAFSGTFDGGDHTISGLYTASESDYAGLFGVCENASISNLNLTFVYLVGERKLGGLAGSLLADGNLTVNNCNVEGLVSGRDAVGGLLGWASSVGTGKLTVNDCSFSGAVNGKTAAGGILGTTGSDTGTVQLISCKNTGRITAESQVGGIAGKLTGESDQVMSCKNNGAVQGESQVGGIVGLIGSAKGIVTLSDCQNGGTLLSENSVGGIAGEVLIEGEGVALELLSSRNVGDVYGSASVGGILGLCRLAGSESTVRLVANKNSSAVNGNQQVGGIIGTAEIISGSFSVSTCENYGAISASSDYAGGILGYAVSSSELHLYECSVLATIAVGASYGGGIAGQLTADGGSVLVERSSAGGGVKAATVSGGIVGKLIANAAESSAVVQNCLSAVTLSAGEAAGGMVGQLTAVDGKSRISSSLFCGGIVTGCKITGGIAAVAHAEQSTASAEVVDCYFGNTVSSRAMLPFGGQGNESCLTTEALSDRDLRDPAKLSGLDFTIWRASDTDGQYPIPQSIPFVWEEYQYTVTQSGAILLAYQGRSDLVTIPDKLGGVAVTTISETAFWQSGVIRVTLPDSVTAIGEAAFAGCSRLERVTLSASLVSIGARAFQNCTSLSELRCSHPLSTLVVGSENEPFHALSLTHPVTLQIVHSYEDGSSAGKGTELSYYIGDYYQITPLKITGYEADETVLSGICGGADRISVIYRIGTYHLTIRYLYSDGREALPSYEGDFQFGEAYSVTTPKLDGYSADHSVLEGTMAGEDTQLIVYFNEVFTDTDPQDNATAEIVLLILSGLVTVCCLVYFIYRYRSATDPHREH